MTLEKTNRAASEPESAPERRSRSWLAAIPGLRILVPPAEPVPSEAGATGPVDVPPSSRGGTTLRSSTAAARRGWYAPAFRGAPTTTKQAEILNTALIGPPTGTAGIVNGRDTLSRTLIAHDAATAYNSEPRQVTSPNVLVFGTVGSGKSSFVKTVCVIRPLLLKHRRAVVFDKKDDGGQGEYADLTRRLGAEPLRFTTDTSGTRLNLLDPVIARGTGIKGQFRLLAAITRVARNDEALSKWEEEAVRAALKALHAHDDGGRTLVAADLLPHLGRVVDDPDYRELSAPARDQLHRAGLSVRWALTGLLDEYAGLLDGETSNTVDLSHKLTSFDLSQLPDDGPAVPVVMAIGNMWLTGRLRNERGWVTNVIYEEGWHMIGGPSAQLVKSNQKLSRSLGISNVFVMHKGTDIPPDSPGYTVVQEAQTVYVFNQARTEDAHWATTTFGFAPETAATLMRLKPGHCVFKYGANPETHLQHVRSTWETEVTNTDSALAAATR
jgi:hypothetical protein